MTTERETATQTAAPRFAASDPPYAQGAMRVRARAAVSAVTHRVRAVGRALGLRGEARGSAAGTLRAVAATPPPSLAALRAYTAAGDWVPGEQARVLEFAGKAYGYLVALPVSVALYAVSLLIQRPTRLALAAFVLGVVWVTTSWVAVAALAAALDVAAACAVARVTAPQPPQSHSTSTATLKGR